MRIRLLFLSTLFVLGLSAAAAAQTPTPVPSPTPATIMLAWEHDEVNLDGFHLYVDSGTPNATVTDMGLPPKTGVQFRYPFPALTPGVHQLEVDAYNIAGNSGRASLSVRVVVVPVTPTNFQIITVQDQPLVLQELRLRETE